MLVFLKRNLAWMLLSLVLSTGLWLSVTIEQNPEDTDTFASISVEVRGLPAGMALRNEVPAVRIRVSAPRDVWPDLRPETFTAVADASKIGPGVHEVSVIGISGDRRARIESVEPDRILLHLEPLRTKPVPVRVRTSGSVPVGHVVGDPEATPPEVTVGGPQTLVEQVVAASAEVSVEGARSSISDSVTIVPVSSAGATIERVTLSTEKVVVEVPIDQQRAHKTVPVVPRVVGTVAFGYQIVGIMVDPASTTIAGDPRVLENVDYVSTQTVDVSGALGDIAVHVDVDLQPEIELGRSQQILVRVLISPIDSSKLLEVAPRVRGLADRLQASVSPGALQVTVSGPMPVLTTLRPQDIEVTIDATPLTPGSHTIKPRVTLPSPLKLVEIAPATVTVTVR